MSDDDKVVYTIMALEEAEKHKRDHPDYKFRPQRKVSNHVSVNEHSDLNSMVTNTVLTKA